MKSPDSIFSTGAKSTWDQVFTDLEDSPPILPHTNPRPKTMPRPGPNPPHAGKARRQTMTAREISAFDEMFDMIFQAVSSVKTSTTSTQAATTRDSDTLVGIGSQSNMSELFGKLRQRSRKMRWTTASDELLDRKKEEMELCDTDQQLLNWALREVFGESQRYEEAARRAISEAAKAGQPPPPPASMPMLQPETYPHVIALLMRYFRDKYNDPHLALSIFDHAKHLSVSSYVFGCTTPAYNELIETRWRCFRDLKGVCDALEEMRVNGVETDGRTRKITEALRREVGERTIWEQEEALGSGEVLDILGKIERLMAKKSHTRGGKKSRNSSSKESERKRDWSRNEEWKSEALQSSGGSEDTWEFDHWEARS